MMDLDQKLPFITTGLVVVLVALGLFSTFLLKEEAAITGFAAYDPVPDTDPVVYLTFDDPADPWKDYSSLGHDFTAQGTVSHAYKGICKYYGCLNSTDNTLLTNPGDNILAQTEWENMDGIAYSIWFYHELKPGSPNDVQGYWEIVGTNTTMRTTQDGVGVSPSWEAESGTVGYAAGSGQRSNAGQWYHVFSQYHPESGMYELWIDGVNIRNVSQDYGSLNYESGATLKLASTQAYNQDLVGYIDEFIMWNYSNFTTSEIREIYNSRRLGTPPDLDLYVETVSYTLPVNWESEYNFLSSEDIDIVINIKNAGTSDSSAFSYEFNLDDTTLCSGQTSISAQSESNISCSWSPTLGMHAGSVEIDIHDDVSEDNENNNQYRVYIPFLNRPWFHFNLSEWQDDIKPYCDDPENSAAYNSCNWFKTFGCSAFNEGYDGNSVDPYGKKARECAMVCLYNDYDESHTACVRAFEHLEGWANRTVSSYDNVQSVHELAHVGMAYDLMFPNLTREQALEWGRQYHDIAQRIYNLNGVRPDQDDADKIEGDNGKGFGSGMGGFTYTLLGAYPENPSMHQVHPQSYYPLSNMVDQWMQREEHFLRAYKNDSWSNYQEGWNYKFYAGAHLVENWWFEKKYNFSYLDDYSNALCSFSREFAINLLDYTYNGETLRNDENRRFRGITRGDSNSYEDPGSGTLLGFGAAYFYGVLCDDPDTKQALAWLYDKANDLNEPGGRITVPGMYMYREATRDITIPETAEGLLPKFVFDNNNDILTIRTNYTYQNDTVIQIDGGEEKGAGHSQAQGMFLYALGEPFLDYEQVPYEDDVRAEDFKNTISFQDFSGGSMYSETCGNADKNQYYGMSDCAQPTYPDDYPDHRHFPLQYGGDLEDYMGTEDADVAGVFRWQPYEDADTVDFYFIKFGDLLAKRIKVSDNQENNIYHNFINIYDEFSESRDGNNITFSRNNKNLAIEVINTNQTLSVGGGDSGIQYCFSKTNCDGSYGGAGNYRRTYLHTPSSDLDMTLSFHWYLDGEKKTITPVQDVDKGMQQEDRYIIFDTSSDGITQYGSYSTDGWGMAFNSTEIAAFNATTIDIGYELFSSDIPISVHIERSADEYILTANTYMRRNYIDFPEEATVTIDARELTNSSNFTVTRDGQDISLSESQTTLTFTAETGQNSDTFVIRGGSGAGGSEEPGEDPPDEPPSLTFLAPSDSLATSSLPVTFSYTATDDNDLRNITLYANFSGSYMQVNSTAASGTSQSGSFIHSLQLGEHIWSISATDNSTTTYSQNRTITITQAADNAPSITYLNPLDSADTEERDVTFSYTATDDNDLTNITLHTNITGTYQETNSTAVSGTSSSGSFVQRAGYGDLIWSIAASDASQTTYSQNRTLTVNQPVDNPPSITALSPQDGTRTSEQTLNFTYTATDENLSSAALYTNISGTFSYTDTQSISGTEHSDYFTLYNVDYGEYIWSLRITDSATQSAWSANRTISVENATIDYPRADTFDGATTDFTAVNIENVSNVTLEVEEYGRILIHGNTDVTGLDLDTYVDMGRGTISLDSRNLTALNKSATLYMYNLTYSNPRILRDGSVCSSEICTIISYNGTLVFDVTHFTNYTVQETPRQEEPAVSSSSSGGGGGLSGGAVPTTEKVSSQSHVYSKLEAGSYIEFEPDDSAVRKLSFMVTQYAQQAEISVSDRSIPMDPPEGEIYETIEIEASGFPELEDIEAEFRVPRSWIEENSISSVALQRYDGGWEKLDTELDKQTSSYNHYTAELPGFSYFAITGVKSQPIVIEKEEPEPEIESVPEPIQAEPQEQEPTPVPKEPEPAVGIIALIIAAVLIAGIAGTKMIKVDAKKMVHKKAKKPLKTKKKDIHSLYDLALHLVDMSEKEFEKLGHHRIASWIHRHLEMPDVAEAARHAPGRKGLYTLLYNIFLYEHKPDKDLILVSDDSLLSLDMTKMVKPLHIGHVSLHSLDNLYKHLQHMKDAEFQKHRKEILEWSRNFGHLEKALKRFRTRESMLDFFKTIRVEQELKKILSKRA